MAESEQDVKYAQSPITHTIYKVYEWEEKGDGRIVSQQKEEIHIDDVPEERVCAYCETNLGIEWSDQGKWQCRYCSPNFETNR